MFSFVRGESSSTNRVDVDDDKANTPKTPEIVYSLVEKKSNNDTKSALLVICDIPFETCIICLSFKSKSSEMKRISENNGSNNKVNSHFLSLLKVKNR